jgi:hypothetical protein
VFAIFARTGSARTVGAEFNSAGLFPVRIRKGAHKGELARMSLRHWRVLATREGLASLACLWTPLSERRSVSAGSVKGRDAWSQSGWSYTEAGHVRHAEAGHRH